MAARFSVSWLLALWVAMVVASVGILASRDFPVAVRNPLFAQSVATTTTLVSAALLQLGILRFLIFGRRLDLLTALAFGAMAGADLLVSVGGPIWNLQGLGADAGAYLLLTCRAFAGLLLLASVAWGPKTVPRSLRREMAWRGGSLGLLVLLLIVSLLASSGESLPLLVDPRTHSELLATGQTVYGVLGGQAPALLLLNGLTALLLLAAGVGFVGLWLRLADPHVGWLAAAIGLLFFSQLHQFLVPPISTQYVSTADGFRLAAYLVLLAGLVSRLTGEIVERSSREERLRLSREIHEGLAQQLGLLNLRLNRATDRARPRNARAQDLEAAKRLVESASIEARQAITALRTGRVTWTELSRTLGSFAEEFASNHQVDVRLHSGQGVPSVEAEVQAELLRVLQEGMSNALRHGEATALELGLSADPREDVIEMMIRDDGRGFDPEASSASWSGIGLRAMSERLERRGGSLLLESAPGRGTRVRVILPLPTGDDRL